MGNMKEGTQKPSQLETRTGILLGAYAAAPTENFTDSRLKAFSHGVRELPFVAGLELPYSKTGLLPFAGPQPQDQLAEGWSFAITALPGQMETMKDDPRFGLASLDHDGRARAVDFIFHLFDEARELMRARPDARLIAIEIHSGPRPFLVEGVEAGFDAFCRSLEEITAERDFRDLLVIEHCDAFQGAKGNPAKGFLTLEEELHASELFGLGNAINWGRSVIEGHDPVRALEHLKAAQRRLRGLIFSGAAQGSELYGTWQDSHAPFREAAAGVNGDSNALLLTEERARQALSCLPERAFVGLKVQPLPKSMDIEARLEFLEANLRVLGSILGSR